jgi:hypothetical protein
MNLCDNSNFNRPAAKQATEKPLQNFVIPSEARYFSFFSWGQIEERFLASLEMTK